jgi:hypothetical protein
MTPPKPDATELYRLRRQTFALAHDAIASDQPYAWRFALEQIAHAVAQGHTPMTNDDKNTPRSGGAASVPPPAGASPAASVLPDWRKKCPCCGTVYTWEGWQALPKIGKVWVTEDEHGDEQVLESRNCTCGSTQSVDLMKVVDAATQQVWQ